MMTRLRRVADLAFRAREQVERAQQVLARVAGRQRLEAIGLAFRGDLRIADTRRVDPNHEEIAHEPRELAADDSEVEARFDHSAGQRERGRGVFVGHRFRDLELEIAADEAEHAADVLERDAVAREREHLVERGERIAHAAFGRPRHERQRGVVDLDLLVGGHPLELIANRAERQRLELEHLRPRLDRRRHRVQLRRRHHELDVRRRLLDRLQQRVERALREAVDFVDDENLVSIAHGRDRERLDDDLANSVDARIRGAVDFEHIDVAAFGDLETRVALAARLRRRPRYAVERARQNPRRRRLADTARAGEDERLREPAGLNRVLQREHDAALADDVLETLRTPLTSESEMSGGHGSSWKFEVRSSKLELTVKVSQTPSTSNF